MRRSIYAICLMLLMLTTLLPLAAPAETAAMVAISRDVPYDDIPTLSTTDAAFINWLRSLLSVDAPCDPPETAPANAVYRITFFPTGNGDPETYRVWHDDLNNLACVTRPDGTVHSVSVNLPMMLDRAVYEPVSFSIVEEHRALLQQYGWTIAFRHPHMLVQLPKKLEASRTDPAALHFTWADLFLRDAGYDLTPYLGKAVVPYVYTLYETVPRAAFYTDDLSDVRSSMYAVVLECNGQLIGAYLTAHSWDGSNLMSLKGNGAPVLLGDTTISAYLLERLPINAAERETAALTPEEVLLRYGTQNDPALTEIRILLRQLATATPTLFNPLSLMASPSTSAAVQVNRKLDLANETMYEVSVDGHIFFPALVYESPETGWKIESFYNTGW